MKFLFFLACAGAMAQIPDPSGNAMLSGVYQFRMISVANFTSTGGIGSATAASGAIVFDGAGHYSITGIAGSSALVLSGSYTIGSGGFGSVINPLFPADNAETIYGGAAQGIFVGSSTEGTSSSIFVAIPVAGAPGGSSAGAYQVAVIDFAAMLSSVSNMNASAVNAAAGARTMMQSPDGRFVLGWTPGGLDLLFGVRTTGASSIPQGLYYVAGLEDSPASGNSCGDLDAFYGSMLSDGNGNRILHQRLASPMCYPVDFQTSNYAAGYQLAIGDTAFVGVNAAGSPSLTIGVHANNFSGSGVFLNPIGVTSAASFAPPTMPVAPGELITLYGSGLAPEAQSIEGGQAFPTTLGGVQVMVNGTAAPVYYVSPTAISLIVPYGVSANSSGFSAIQVNNNGTKSNTITLFAGNSAPGIFTQSENGIGYGAAIHASSGQVITASNPAQPGETIAIFLTGLGAVAPSIADGALGPVTPLSRAQNRIAVFFDDFSRQSFPQAQVIYAGLAPGLAGLYQLNVRVPAGVGPGDVSIEIVTDSADVIQSTIPVGVLAQ